MVWPLLSLCVYYLLTRVNPHRRPWARGFIGYVYQEATDPFTAKGWQPMSRVFGKAVAEEMPAASPFESLFSLYHNRSAAWSFGALQLAKMFILFTIFGAGMLGAAAELGIAIALSLIVTVFVLIVRPYVSNLQNLAELLSSACELLVYIIFIASSLQSGANHRRCILADRTSCLIRRPSALSMVLRAACR